MTGADGPSISPNSCMGVRAHSGRGRGCGSMPQETRIVGLDVAKSKVDACIHSLGLRLSTESTPEGEAKLVAWLRADRVGRVVMEASGGGEPSSAETLRAAGLAVAGRRSEASPAGLRQGGRPAGQERSDRRRDDRPVRRGLSRRQRPTARSRASRSSPVWFRPGKR